MILFGENNHRSDERIINGQRTKYGGLRALVHVARFHGKIADVEKLATFLHLNNQIPGPDEILRASEALDLKVRLEDFPSFKRLARLPTPSILLMKDGSWWILGEKLGINTRMIYDSLNEKTIELSPELIYDVGINKVFTFAPRQHQEPSEAGAKIGWFTNSVQRQRATLTSVLIASSSIQILSIMTPLAFQLVVDKALVHKSYSTLIVVCSALAVIALFTMVLKQLRNYALYHASSCIDAELGYKLLGHLLTLPIGYFERRPAGAIITKLRELENIRAFFTGQGIISIVDATFSVLMISVLFFYSAYLGCIFLISIPIYLLIPFVFRPTFRRLIKLKVIKWTINQQLVVEILFGISMIKAFGIEKTFVDQWGRQFTDYIKTSFETSMVATTAQSAIEFVTKLSTALTLFFGAGEVINGHLTVGGLIAFNMISNQIMQPILRMSQMWQDYQQVRVSVRDIGKILAEEPEPILLDADKPSTISDTIRFDNVSFRYSSDSEYVLRQIDFSIAKGENIGIIGASGSGKSTLAKLLIKSYAPTRGKIMLGDFDIQAVDTNHIRRNIGIVQQESMLFNRSIIDNITLGDPNVSRSDAVAAAKLAGAYEFIWRLPSKFDSIVEERGSNLSGGQRQRIAIARALVRNPQILILDEATSALDYESERAIQNNMIDIVKGRTVIVIAHRLAAVSHCDRIIGMKEGRIVEIGTRSELMNNEVGLYRSLWDIQKSVSI